MKSNSQRECTSPTDAINTGMLPSSVIPPGARPNILELSIQCLFAYVESIEECIRGIRGKYRYYTVNMGYLVPTLDSGR